MPQPNQITLAQLMRLIGTPDAPMIVDVRVPEDLTAIPARLPGSVLMAHDAPQLASLRAPRAVVVTCMRGRKLSEGAASLLRAHGQAAEVLEGGNEAWAAAGLPMIPHDTYPTASLWVTRHRPKIDRIACPWLIRRFVDPAARFLFVAPAEVQAVAGHFSAIAFDVEHTHWSHRGDGCTFDAMLDDWGLRTEALDRLALVVRAADTDRHDLAPQAAGLLALSVGLSRMYRDDLAQLDAGIALYDAMYRWARDGHDEGHDWPAGRGA